MATLTMGSGPEDLDSQLALVRSGDEDAVESMLLWGNPRPEVFEHLLASPSSTLRSHAARSRSVPAELLECFLHDPASCCEAAGNANLSVELQREAFASPRLWEGLARNISLDPEILPQLVKGDPAVRQNLAARDGLPEGVLRELVVDTDDTVRSILANNRSVPAWVLDSLMGDTSLDVLAQVASNSNDAAAVAFLRHDEVRIRAAYASSDLITSAVQVELATDQSQRVRRVLADSWTLDVLAALVLTRDALEDVRLLLADNPSLHGPALTALANDPSEKVRATLAYQHDLPSEVQLLFAHDAQYSVRESLASCETLSRDAYEVLASDDTLAHLLASCEHVPLHEQQRYLDLGLEVREGLAHNPKLVDEVRDALLERRERSVAERLAENAHFRWTPLIPADLALRYASAEARSYALAAGADLETWNALIGSWTGTVEELAQAVHLTLRP